jgi:membrane peptidoglycan carboxypeptidase
MYFAVNIPGGTSGAARVPDVGWHVAGKTGTAQNPHGEDHAWFVCFAPYEKPKIAICVMVENAGFGGVVSAPIARKLINLYLTGRREDPVPTILPNTDEYRALKEAKYSKDKAIAEAASKKVGSIEPSAKPIVPVTPPNKPKPKPVPAKAKPTAHAVLLNARRELGV